MQASCQCGKLTAEVADGAEAMSILCHCLDCQRRTGSPFGTIAYFPGEAVTVSGFGAEVLARVMEVLGPGGLRAAERLGAPRAPVPFSPPLEDAMRISPARIADAVRRVAAR